MFQQLLKKNALLSLVHLFHSFQNTHRITILFSSLYQRLYIFRETRTTVSTTGIQKFTANTTICTNTFANHIYISTNQFTEVSDIIHKANPCSQHRISSIFYHLSTRNICKYQTIIIHHKRLIKTFHYPFSLFRFHTYHYTVRFHKIINGITFLQKFRIRSYIKLYLNITFIKFFLNGRFDFLCSTYRNCTFGYNKYILIHITTNSTGYLQHIFQISTTILIRRGTNRTEHNLYIIQTFLQICRKFQTTCCIITVYHIFQTRFINRNNTFFQILDLTFLHIHTSNIHSHLRETSTCN